MKKPQSIKALDARFKTHNSRAVPYEFHSVASLARRVLVSRPTAYRMLESGDLTPLDRDKSGRLVFLSAKLDETRKAVVEATTAEILRSLAPLNLSEQESAMHCLSALHELARNATAHELGIGSSILKAAAPLLGARGGALRGAAKWALRNPGMSMPAAGAALGGVGGAIHSATDGDPDTGVLGGSVKGAATGAAVGIGGSAAGSLLAKSPLGAEIAGKAAGKIDAFAPKIRTALDAVRGGSSWLKRGGAKIATDAGPAVAGGIRQAGNVAGRISGSLPAVGIGIGAATGAAKAATDHDPNTTAGGGALLGGIAGGALGALGGVGMRKSSRMADRGAQAIEDRIRGLRGMNFQAKVEVLRKEHCLPRGQAARAVREIDPESYAALEEGRKTYTPKTT